MVTAPGGGLGVGLGIGVELGAGEGVGLEAGLGVGLTPLEALPTGPFKSGTRTPPHEETAIKPKLASHWNKFKRNRFPTSTGSQIFGTLGMGHLGHAMKMEREDGATSRV
jgi:hypothetical protein